jgi:hypothetical protein
MSSNLVRAIAASLSVIAALATSPSWAQGNGGTTGTGSGATTGTSGLAASDFNFYIKYYDPDQANWIQMNDTQKKYFFNRARCECVGDQGEGSGYTGYFKIAIQPAANTPAKIQTLLATNGVGLGDARLYAGSSGVNCLSPSGNPGVVAGSCTNLLNPTSDGYSESFALTVFESAKLYESPPIAVSTLFGSLTACGPRNNCGSIDTCQTGFSTQTIFFWVRSTGRDYPDTSDISFTLNLNGELQYGPTGLVVDGGNEALMLSWTWATGLTPSADPNFLGLQVFCQRAADIHVYPLGSYGPSYQQSTAICPGSAPVIESPSAFSNLSPSFLCSGLLPSTTTSYRISGLQNGIYYGVSVAAVDKYGNISGVDPDLGVAWGMPVATVDFYTQYRNDGGQAQGGFCSLAGWRKRPSALVLLGALAVMLVLVSRRRRKGPPGSPTLLIVLAAGTLAAGQARAQAVFHEEESDSSPEEPQQPDAEPRDEPPAPDPVWMGTERDFAVELRFGLYAPNIDSEFNGQGRSPNQFIFGSERRPMWQAELDWEILQYFGTLSVGGSIGYWKESAQACLASDLDEAKGRCTRKGDGTSLRLIPFAALLVYRLDEAAKRWRIPLVPYGKVGLNYTIWTVSNGDGNVPEYKSNGGGHGQGGTAGWQAAVGLSLQLDFIDPAAAREFDSESGVNHTYAFFELAHVDGSGLYRKDVLRVGDNTWFAGLMFEF